MLLKFVHFLFIVFAGWDIRKERGVETLTNHYWELAEYLEHVVIVSRDLSWPDNDTLITAYYTAVEQALHQRIVAGIRAQVRYELWSVPVSKPSIREL